MKQTLRFTVEVSNITRSSGKNYFAYFPYIRHLFEVHELNLTEPNLSELTLTSFNSVHVSLTEFTAVNNLVAMVTMERKQSKPIV
jgi:hypothetical protein